MRNLTFLLVCLCLLASATTTMANRMADSLAFQGRLTDASDNPVPDGPRDLTLSLWTDPVGGTMLHSEIVVVTVSKGLYSTCIGCTSSSFFDIFTDQSVYLQVQLAGSPPMTPRTTLRSVPFSVSSSGVHGEATNGAAKAKGIISVKSAYGSGSMTNGKFLLDADSDGDGVAEASDSSGVSEEAAGRRLQVHNLGSSGQDGVEITPISAGRRLAVHNLGSSGNDGVEVSLFGSLDSLVESKYVRKSGAVVAADYDYKSMSRNSRRSTFFDIFADLSIEDDCDASGAWRKLTANNIGSSGQDGVELSARPGGIAEIRCDSDSDGDGIPESEVSHLVTPTTSGVAIKEKGTGADPRRSAVMSTAGLDSATVVCEYDDDGDGIPESSLKEYAHPHVCESRIEHRSGSTTGTIHMAASPDSTSSAIDHDSDDDGIPESEISQLVTPTTSGVAIKVKGTGAEKNRTAGSSCDDSLAINYLDIDDDGDGTSEAHAVSSVSSLAGGGGGAAAASYAATGRWYTDSDDDGVPEGDIDAMVTPTASYVAIKTKGTGAANNRSSITSTTDTAHASSVMAVDLDDDGLADRSVTMDCDDTDGGITVEGASSAVKIRHKGWDGLIYGRMAIETGGAIEVDFGGNGVGFVSQRFGIGVLSPTHPIEHSSGAHLTAGGVWTNASDENLKENFQHVDGAKLLEKLEDLPISQWNYKNESDEVTHIGPTAQDFQKAFGVGENDKTISTIDPSGIALAAIKELNNKLNTQNQTLSQENKQLRKEMDDLKKMVQELAKSK